MRQALLSEPEDRRTITGLVEQESSAFERTRTKEMREMKKTVRIWTYNQGYDPQRDEIKNFGSTADKSNRAL